MLLIAAATPLMLMALFVSYTAVSTQRDQLEARALANARLLSESVDREVAGAIDQAEGLAASPALDAPVDLESFRQVARRELARHPKWMNVLLVTPEDERVVQAVGAITPNAPVDPASLSRVVETGRPTVGAMGLNTQRGWGIAVRAPVIRDGRLTHVTTVVVRPVAFHALIEAMKPGPNWIVTIVNHEGRVVARSAKEATFIGKMASESALAARRRGPNGIYEGYTLDKVHTISAWWTSPASGWSVHIGVPKTQFQTPLQQLMVLLAVGFVLAALLAVAFILLLLRELRQRQAEVAAVEQATRMDALGRLTGGVAHDFNNLLMVIQGNIDILARRAPDDPRLQSPLGAMRAATERAAKLTRQLLIFARGGGSERLPTDLAAVARAVELDLRQLAGPEIGVRLELPAEPAVVDLDRLQCEAALLNLVANARDATRPATGEIVVTVAIDGERVRLDVRDQGPGFTGDVLTRAFDPFFTTKPVGQGTGLGLTQVYRFVRDAGGRVELQNPPGGGGLVRLDFPRSQRVPTQADLGEPVPVYEALAAPVLLVEDDPAVRATVAAFLVESGLQVRVAADAAEALALLERETFGAMLSDVIMPGPMSGSALALAVRRRWPSLPVVLISGYSDAPPADLEHGFTVLTKPIDLNAVVRQLRALMAA